MANPFKEAEKKAKVAPGGNKPQDAEKTEEVVKKLVETAPPVVTEASEAPVAAVEPAPVAEKPKVEKKTTQSKNKIESLIGPAKNQKKQERSTMTIYIAKENQAWLKEMAEQRGKSMSVLLDEILNELRS